MDYFPENIKEFFFFFFVEDMCVRLCVYLYSRTYISIYVRDKYFYICRRAIHTHRFIHTQRERQDLQKTKTPRVLSIVSCPQEH